MQQIWREYIWPRLVMDMITFYPPLMLAGWFASRLEVGLPLFAGFLANYLMLVFCFVINDIADREEDARSQFKSISFIDHIKSNIGLYKWQPGQKRFTNVFSHNLVSVDLGWAILVIITLVALLLSYWVGGLATTVIALINIAVGFAYSVKPLRLKARPLWDLLSHATLLAGIQVVYFLSYPKAHFDFWACAIAGFLFLFSIGSDLENEYRDFEDDQLAGIRNTATLLGKSRTRILSVTLKLIALALLIGGVIGILIQR